MPYTSPQLASHSGTENRKIRKDLQEDTPHGTCASSRHGLDFDTMATLRSIGEIRYSGSEADTTAGAAKNNVRHPTTHSLKVGAELGEIFCTCTYITVTPSSKTTRLVHHPFPAGVLWF